LKHCCVRVHAATPRRQSCHAAHSCAGPCCAYASSQAPSAERAGTARAGRRPWPAAGTGMGAAADDRPLSQVVAEATPWQGGTVAISNFGFGGSNVHCLVSGRARAAQILHAPPAAPGPVPAAADAPAPAALDPTVRSARAAPTPRLTWRQRRFCDALTLPCWLPRVTTPVRRRTVPGSCTHTRAPAAVSGRESLQSWGVPTAPARRAGGHPRRGADRGGRQGAAARDRGPRRCRRTAGGAPQAVRRPPLRPHAELLILERGGRLFMERAGGGRARGASWRRIMAGPHALVQVARMVRWWAQAAAGPCS